MDRFGIFDDGFSSLDDRDELREEGLDAINAMIGEEDILTAFLCCKAECCASLELAAEQDALEDADWLPLKQHLHHIAGTAGFFRESELGVMARDLEHGLDILSPSARIRRLRNARMEFLNLAARGAS